MGKRKFRLYNRKGRMSSKFNSKSLLVSFPKTVYLLSPFQSLFILRERLQSTDSLPKGYSCTLLPFYINLIILTDWLDIDDDISCAITFRKLYNPEHNIFLSLRIHHNGSWKLTIDKTILDTIRCTLLRDLPKQINCVSDVVAIFKVIDSSHLCYGNLEPKFCSLQIKSG